ncbi:histidine kinase [Dactylosporangium sp. AC04546]|nr:histidine kinase [Dactylosporangium sp. AC04546]
MVLQARGAARLPSYEHAVGPNAESARNAGIRSAVGVPILVEGGVWGVAVVASTTSDPLPADTETRMSDFTELVATAIANAESHAELTPSRARIVAAGDEARRRIERNLHDGAQQRLIALGLQLRTIEASLPADPDQAEHELSQAMNNLTGVVQDLQEISRGIHPATLSKGGLGLAVKALARRSSTPVDLKLAIDRRLPEPVEVGAYYVVSEALTNIAKHARAHSVRIDITAGQTCLRIAIRDDGVGGANIDRGSGLIGLQDRIATLEGHMDIVSPAGHGTGLLVEIPINATPINVA